jgi:hypothetical protein
MFSNSQLIQSQLNKETKDNDFSATSIENKRIEVNRSRGELCVETTEKTEKTKNFFSQQRGNTLYSKRSETTTLTTEITPITNPGIKSKL